MTSSKISHFDIQLTETPPSIRWRLRQEQEDWESVELSPSLFGKLKARFPHYLNQSQTEDKAMSKTRKNFPNTGIYAVIGGLSDDNYLSESNKQRYKYITPACPDTPKSSWVADCWVVDKDGLRQPGDVYPVPINRCRIGRRIA